MSVRHIPLYRPVALRQCDLHSVLSNAKWHDRSDCSPLSAPEEIHALKRRTAPRMGPTKAAAEVRVFANQDGASTRCWLAEASAASRPSRKDSGKRYQQSGSRFGNGSVDVRDRAVAGRQPKQPALVAMSRIARDCGLAFRMLLSQLPKTAFADQKPLRP